MSQSPPNQDPLGCKPPLRSWVPRLLDRFYQGLINHSSLLMGLVAGATFLGMLGIRLYLITAYIPDLGGVESNVIYSLQRILDSYPLYADPANPPYSITQYTPLYYHLCWMVGRLVGVEAANVHHVYMLSRSVSLLLNLLFASSAFIILRNVFRIRFSLSLLAFVYAFVYLDEESFSRPDSLFNLLALLTIGLFLQWLTQQGLRHSRSYLIGASTLAIMAIFAKQSAVYLPVLLLFYLVFYLQNHRWTLTALLTMAITFGLLLTLTAQGNFHAFWQNVVQGVNNGVSVSWFMKRIMVEHFQKERFLNIIGLFCGLFFLAQGKSHTFRFLGLSIISSFAFALITSFKIGAAPNYFTEFITLTLIATVLLITSHGPTVNQSLPKNENKGAPSCAPLFYLILVIFTLPPRFGGKFVKKVVEANDIGKSGYVANQAVSDFLYQEKDLQPSEQVFVTTHVHDYLNKFLYRNVIFPQKEIVMANPLQAYDYRSFWQATDEGQVRYIIASLSEGHVDTTQSHQMVKFNFLGADFSSYVPIKQLGDFVVFEHQGLLP